MQFEMGKETVIGILKDAIADVDRCVDYYDLLHTLETLVMVTTTMKGYSELEVRNIEKLSFPIRDKS